LLTRKQGSPDPVDDLSRQRDLVSLVEELTEIGVGFVSATEAFDTSTPAGVCA